MNVPILLLLYKRPETTIHVINALKKVKAKLIYIAINVPPIDKSHKDYQNYKKVLNIVNKINWKCELKIKKRKKHLNSYESYKKSVKWFFKNEKEGIILEDDTVPNQSFFSFCKKLLEKYRNNKKIALISGTSFINKKNMGNESYLFSNFSLMWGYATWRRTINDYDEKMKDWPKLKKRLFSNITKDKIVISYWTKIFNHAYKNKLMAFDYRMVYSNFKKNKLTIIPKKNLVKNIGFGNSATHTIDSGWYSNFKTSELKNIKHPKMIIPNFSYDNWLNNNLFGIKYGHYSKKIKKFKIFNNKIAFNFARNIYLVFKSILRKMTRID